MRSFVSETLSLKSFTDNLSRAKPAKARSKSLKNHEIPFSFSYPFGF